MLIHDVKVLHNYMQPFVLSMNFSQFTSRKLLLNIASESIEMAFLPKNRTLFPCIFVQKWEDTVKMNEG